MKERDRRAIRPKWICETGENEVDHDRAEWGEYAKHVRAALTARAEEAEKKEKEEGEEDVEIESQAGIRSEEGQPHARPKRSGGATSLLDAHAVPKLVPTLCPWAGEGNGPQEKEKGR